MYRFNVEIPIKVNKSIACKIIGLNRSVLSSILNGKVLCRKVTAFSITKYLDKDAEIEDYFIKEERR